MVCVCVCVEMNQDNTPKQLFYPLLHGPPTQSTRRSPKELLKHISPKRCFFVFCFVLFCFVFLPMKSRTWRFLKSIVYNKIERWRNLASYAWTVWIKKHRPLFFLLLFPSIYLVKCQKSFILHMWPPQKLVGKAEKQTHNRPFCAITTSSLVFF